MLLASLIFLFIGADAFTQPSSQPIDPDGWPHKFPAKEHCSRCGLCETTYVSKVKDACAFLDEGMGRLEKLEEKVHGRSRRPPFSPTTNEALADEGRFGVQHSPMRLARGIGMEGSQWTGVVSAIAVSLLEAGKVDAVACVASDKEGSWSKPNPILARTVEQVLEGRGVKPSLAPSLNILDEVKADPSIRRLLFCGVGCSVQALRSIEDELDVEILVLGTNCVDNSPTPEAAANFIETGVGIPAAKTKGYEFMQDFRVHVKMTDGYVTKPYFCLPGTVAEPSIAKSCLACFDYVNSAADVTVGYMAAPLEGNSRMDESWQTLTTRNERGAEMVETAVKQGRLELGEVATGKGDHTTLAIATTRSDAIVQALVGKTPPERGMPLWIGGIMASVFRSISPQGVAFARYSIDYHLLRNYLHLLSEYGEEQANRSMPPFAKEIVSQYCSMDETLVDYKQIILERSP